MAHSTNSKTIAAIKRNRTARLAKLITRSYYFHKRKQDEAMYNLVCEEFMSLGGVYVKFLQGVLLRSEVMRRWHNPEKLRIFENLESEPIDIGAFLRSELSPEKLQNITMVQPQPFAAGSFGQVYYGQLKNGQPIIIKVLRPMVRELLKYDLRLLSTFSKSFFTRLYKNMSIQLKDALAEFSTATLRETDYKHEAAFARELYEAYKNNAYMVIPQTYTELCTDNIIVQDYIDGISVAQVIRMHEQGVDPIVYVKEQLGSDLVAQLQVLGYESIIGVFDLPRVQGDPHPGNIRLMRDNKVGLIDFGISASAPADKNGLYGLFESYDKMFSGSQTASSLFEHSLRFFVSDLYRSLKRLGEYMGKSGDSNYMAEISQVAGDVFEQATGSNMVNVDFKNDASVLVIINKLVNKNNRFGLVMKLEATEILRATQTYTSLVGSLGLYQKVMPSVVHHSIEHIRAAHPEVIHDTKDTVSIAAAIETVTNWLERVAERDPVLFRQLSEKIRINRTTVPKPIIEEEPTHA
jgi:serine/threonine protein kinase